MPKLADVAEINPRFDRSQLNDLSEMVSFVPMANVSEVLGAVTSEQARELGEVIKGFTPFKDRDVLVAKITPCFENGKIAHARIGRQLGFGSTEFHVIRPIATKLDDRYLYHFLRQPSVREEGGRRMTGSGGQKRVPKTFIEALDIPLPSLTEQRRIAATLDKADALRAKRREAIAKLDQLLKSVFLEMFGDPVTNPKGWPGNTTLGDIALDMQYGPRFHNEAYSLNGIKIVRITDLSPTGELDFDAMPRMDVEENVQARFVLQPGDIIFARTGATVGKVALIRASDPPSIAGAYFIRVQVNNSVLPEYVFAALRTKSIQKFIAVKSRQAAQQNFSGPGLRKLPMPVPSLELQCQFASLAKKIEQQRRTLQEHVELQDAFFASLQHRAFNGEL
ncbi:restriction endonuclease subunit S [Pseudomonas protegens]|uniref:restriction endonuclease subunit S n=1 Tax=Pseudomonas protegens TaxID=380021 RepID=UPI001B33326D|nr:restriction endonuclease subunit S [Pseudomonas protegens]MBP5130636.1 restriction endonuclease subunit S [Pseudomonas protegens]MBP5145465.1 restriction endonuclease subunit S [Pseudomonas protegens]